MKIKEPVKISLLDFFKYGKFGVIKLGQTKEWILNNFPDPDAFGVEDMLKDVTIWAYEEIEFHFVDNKLHTIYSDYWNTLSSGKEIILDKWIFEDLGNLNLLYVLTALNKQDIDYNKKTDNSGIRIRLQSGVELFFENVNENDSLSSNEFSLTAFAFSDIK